MLNETKATFRFVGGNVDPASITARLGMTPADGHRKGEINPKHPDHRYPTGYWGLDSILAESASLEDHLLHLLSLLEPRADAIRELLSEGYNADVYCGYFMVEMGTLDLSADLLARIGVLGLGLKIHVYNISEGEATQ